MINLRPYQTDAVAQLRAHFRAGRTRVVLCAPTGSGKTVIFSYLVKATIEKNPNARVLILTDRIELLTQAGGTLRKFGIDCASIAANTQVDHYAKVYVGMVETFFRRVQKFPHLLDLNLVIIDEAHRGNFKKLFPLFKPSTYIIGATATPIAASKKDPLKNYYNDIVATVGIPELIEEGFLVPAETYAAKTDTSKLKTDKTGEYSTESQMDVFAKREVYDGVVNKYLHFGPGEKAICFNVNIEHSIEVCRRFLEVGVQAEHVDGETPSEQRKGILKRFQTGETQVLCNVGIVTTGYDEPSVTMVIINKATTSLPLFLQMAGRGSRIHPGKESFKLIDMGSNWKYLGLWEDERDWKDIFHNPIKAKKKGANDAPAPVKDCPDCDALLKMSERVCPHCGHEFPPELRKPNIVEEVEFDLISSVRPKDWGKLSIEELVKLQTVKEYKTGWILHQLRERAGKDPVVYERLIRELAAYKGYKKGWIPRELENYSSQKSA